MIFGRVIVPQGSPTAGARVVVRNADTNTTFPVTTNETGYYEASLLLPGNYEVTAEAVGFRTSIRKGILLCSSCYRNDYTKWGAEFNAGCRRYSA